MRALTSWVSLLAIALVTAACSGISASYRAYPGAPTYPPTDPSLVEILRSEPGRPHERLGEVTLEPYGDLTVADLEDAVRREAAKLGADAAVIVFDGMKLIGMVFVGPEFPGAAVPEYRRTIVAVAIHYT